MINLLPDDDKNAIKAARHNVLLLRYTGITFLALASLLGVMYSSHAILTGTKTSAESTIESSTIEADVYNETKEKVDELTNQLSDVKGIVQREVHFSRVLTNIASLMPSGTVIKDIKLNTQNINSPMTITVFSKTTDSLLALQSAFQGSPLFMNVNFQSVGDSDGSVEGYPTSVTMTVILNTAGFNE